MAFDQRTVACLDLGEFGKRLWQGKPVRIAGINARDEGVDGVVEKLLAQTTQNKLSDALLRAVSPGGNERLPQDRQFGFGSEEFRGEKPEGRAGHGDGPFIAHDIARLGARVRSKPTRVQARIANKLPNFG